MFLLKKLIRLLEVKNLVSEKEEIKCNNIIKR